MTALKNTNNPDYECSECGKQSAAELIRFVIELARNECRKLQMYPTVPVSEVFRKAYNVGVCEAGNEIEKLDAEQILAEFKAR